LNKNYVTTIKEKRNSYKTLEILEKQRNSRAVTVSFLYKLRITLTRKTRGKTN